MLQLEDMASAFLRFTDLDGKAIRLDLDALSGLSTEGRDPVSGQRRPDIAVAEDAAISGVRETGEGWLITLASGQVLTLPLARLMDYGAPGLWRIEPRAWPQDGLANLPVHDYAAFAANAEIRRQVLLQLAVYGFARLGGAPVAPYELETLIATFGCVRETNYGRIFDVRTKMDAANLADTALALAPHTDNPYRLSPPELQVLHCLGAAGSGGQSVLVDGLSVVEALRSGAREDFDLLCRVPALFAWADETTRLECEAPVISLKLDGSLDRIRYNPRSLQGACTPSPDERAAWLAACSRLGERLKTAPRVTFDMVPGDMVLMDNRRLLHGRTAFDGAGDVVRHLQGAYADIDGVHSTLRRLTEAHVAHELDALETVFESEALSQAYGEDISLRDHMLQAAEGAVARQKGPDLVAAALLHDIGWGMAGTHETAAATLLAPRLGENVASLVRNHVDAKRYLVAVRPDYAANLSAASVETLGRQGGPMTDAECRAFEGLPNFQDCLELRYLDEAGKEIRSPGTTFARYRELVRRLMIRNALAGAISRR